MRCFIKVTIISLPFIENIHRNKKNHKTTQLHATHLLQLLLLLLLLLCNPVYKVYKIHLALPSLSAKKKYFITTHMHHI